VLINETGVAELGLIQPVGKVITDSRGDKYEIIGVVSDFNIGSLHEKIPPTVINIRPNESMVCQVAVKINKSSTINQMIPTLSDKWDEFGPGGRFEYFWMDEKFNTQYNDDRRFAKTFRLFTILTIFVASLGLFGFSLFSSVQRVKEVGIRKSFGATTNEIVRLVLREYVLVILLANLISWPLGWYFSRAWLQNYAYKTEIGWVIFAVAALFSGLVLLVTIGYNTRKLAENNPVDSLKYE